PAPVVRRMPRLEREAQLLAQAATFFSEHGLSAQTRALAKACGVSQRLLYSFFPSKSALLEEVYRRHIAGAFQDPWLSDLQDRSQPIEQRLIDFYATYYDQVTTRGWLRLFLFASLAEVTMASDYIASVLSRALSLIIREAAHAQGLRAPRSPAAAHEIAWVLHGAVSHLAIRRHVYGNANPIAARKAIALQVKIFLGGLSQALPQAAEPSRTRARPVTAANPQNSTKRTSKTTARRT
ncbi:MAG: TetR/AcrR family transcriptional regulator, partial [Burkholderiales bacterium]